MLKIIKYIVLFFCISLATFSLSQQDLSNFTTHHRTWLNSTNNVQDSAKYDFNTQSIFIAKYVGKCFLSKVV